jgi:lipopolysaccharide/colanic/teichoic acid biosynthesis glycosyltransferase
MSVLVPASQSFRRAHLSIGQIALALACPILALYLRNWDILIDAVVKSQWSIVGWYWIATAAFSLIGLSAFRIQDEVAYNLSSQDILNIIKAVILTEVATAGSLFLLTRLDGIPRSTPIIHGLLLAAALIIHRMLLARHNRNGNSDADPSKAMPPDAGAIIVIGANRHSAYLIQLLNAEAPNHKRVVAVLDEGGAQAGRVISGIPIVGSPRSLEAIVEEFTIHGVRTQHIIVAGDASLLSDDSLLEIQRVCVDRQLALAFLPNLVAATVPNKADPTSAREPEPDPQPLPPPSFFRVKRWIDICGSVALILFLLPLLSVAALLVFWDVGQPILFWQRRQGRNRRNFNIFKFRTLRAPFDSHGHRIPEANRMSSIGRLLRMTRIDELPQLLNVLNGDMSLIGPRPLLPEDQPTNATVRLSVRPGITGWAQVCGGKLVSTEDKGKLDEWYIRNASPWLDLRIAYLTLRIISSNDQSIAETTADEQQVRAKSIDTHRSTTSTTTAPVVQSGQ